MMQIPILIPDLGAPHEQLRLCAWYIEPGELVEVDEPLLEVLIGGATCDVTAPCRGRVAGPLRLLDSLVVSGETVGWLEPTA